MCIAQKLLNNALNYVSSFRERVAVSGTRGSELLSSSSAALGPLSTTAAELHQTRDMISTRSKELAKFSLLNMSIRGLYDNAGFYEASEKGLKGDIAEEMAKSTQLGELFDSTRAQRVYLRE